MFRQLAARDFNRLDFTRTEFDFIRLPAEGQLRASRRMGGFIHAYHRSRAALGRLYNLDADIFLVNIEN